MIGLCECKEDGFCPRYNREMIGRFRQICQGVNVDLGTAAAFREQWYREAGDEYTKKMHQCPKAIPLLLKMNQAPGDAVAMTAAIHSLHTVHPGKFNTAVESRWPEVFANNTHVSEHFTPGVSTSYDRKEVAMHYPAVHKSNDRGIHFMQGWCEFLSAALGVGIPLMTNRPHLYFDTPSPKVEDFWLICSGGKSDFTTKLWGHDRYQMLVDYLKNDVDFIQVGGTRKNITWEDPLSQLHYHSKLDRVLATLVGQTTLTDLFQLVRRARGVVCGVSLLMHVAAALEKPCVVIAGGREPVQWNAYPLQHYLHTVGMLPCTDIRGRANVGCWRYRTEPLGDHPTLDANTCLYPEKGTPKCLTMIQPEDVAKLVSRLHHARSSTPSI